MYMYDPFWMKGVYIDGIEESAKANADEIPVPECGSSFNDENMTINIEDNKGRNYYWIPQGSESSEGKVGNPSKLEASQIRLFGKQSEESTEYEAVLDVVQHPDGERLISCKDFNTADPIIFVSKAEIENRMLFLGGVFARTSKRPEQCNAYLTKGRMLRCTRPIREGDEIIRWTPDSGVVVDYFERIDRVVVCMNNPVPRPGKIAPDRVGPSSSFLVKFQNGESEVFNAEESKRLAFVYKDMTAVFSRESELDVESDNH